ncbi:hypothetical protein GOAMI_22_00590 [Gordonia amicalis NBRC 100051 = JCM 11271]|nr:hypothetical protein GOAMI_22_00590 [Gordonia amicalis NBRC 100051 = JCM 11271]
MFREAGNDRIRSIWPVGRSAVNAVRPTPRTECRTESSARVKRPCAIAWSALTDSTTRIVNGA